jgi:hypothetical protein
MKVATVKVWSKDKDTVKEIIEMLRFNLRVRPSTIHYNSFHEDFNAYIDIVEGEHWE